MEENKRFGLGTSTPREMDTLIEKMERGDRGGVYLVVVPGNAELDLKALARIAGDRKVEMVPLSEVQQLTGYIRGGVTALGGKRDYPVFADETIDLFDTISISAGVRGTQMLLSPGDYLRAVKATVGAIAREIEDGSKRANR
jgi:Cys-tRNA(Pro)/Cys-tRNA(Cys) deacylase